MNLYFILIVLSDLTACEPYKIVTYWYSWKHTVTNGSSTFLFFHSLRREHDDTTWCNHISKATLKTLTFSNDSALFWAQRDVLQFRVILFKPSGKRLVVFSKLYRSYLWKLVCTKLYLQKKNSKQVLSLLTIVGFNLILTNKIWGLNIDSLDC